MLKLVHSLSPLWALSPPVFAGLRRRARSHDRRVQRVDLDGLSDTMRRDLGFADGRAAPPRDPLRD